METPNYNLRGNLYKNSRKRPDKKDPDYTGVCTVGDVSYFMDAWINTNDKNEKYLGIKFKAREQQPATKPAVQDDAPFDDEIPF